MIVSRPYKMWALSYMFDDNRYFLDKFCWQPPDKSSWTGIVLFRTRKLAREAQKTCCYYSKIEKVVVTIKELT